MLLWAPSLTRGQVCNLQLLLGLASAVLLGSEFRGSDGQILLSEVSYSPSLVGKVTYLFPRKEGSPVLHSIGWSKFLFDFATDGHSATSSWSRAAFWSPWPDSKFFLVFSPYLCAPLTGCPSQVNVKVKANLRPTESQPVSSDVSPPSGGPWTLFLLKTDFSQLRGCYYGALSLTRTRVYNLQLLRGSPAQSLLGPRSSQNQSPNYILTDGQSASLSWCQTTI
jgi:hypothetical protein